MTCLLLLQLIKEFRDDELEHHDTGLEHDAESVSHTKRHYCFSIFIFLYFFSFRTSFLQTGINNPQDDDDDDDEII